MGQNSYKQAIAWLEKYKLEFESISKNELSEAIIKHILSLSDGGFNEIIVSAKKSMKPYKAARNYFHVKQLTTSDMIRFILNHTEFLRAPIIFDDKKILVGYHKDDIRVFLPHIKV